GSDWAVYWYASSYVFADLLFPGLNSGDAFGDTYDSIENLGGSQLSDHLGGDNLPNIIRGLDANDLIAGRGGDDQLFGETGNDTLIGEAGNDVLDGGDGGDALDGGDGDDTANYQDAPAGVVVDFISPGSNTGYAFGDSYISIEHLIGSQYDDGLSGNDNPNIILGGAGNDSIGGRGGDDQLFGETGNDTLIGGAGNDALNGGGRIGTADFHGPHTRYLVQGNSGQQI